MSMALSGTGSETITARAHKIGASTIAALTILFTACFHYAPVPIGSVPRGKELRVNLTETGYANLRDSIGDQFPQLRSRLEGSLIALDDRRLIVGVAVSAEGSGRELQQRIAVPRSDILGVERKTLDRKQTGIIALGASVALAIFSYHWISGEFGGTTHPIPEPGQGETILVPIGYLR